MRSGFNILLFLLVSYIICNIGLGQNPIFAMISSITLYTFIDLLKSVGKTVPIVELAVFFMVLQMLYTPAIEFYFYPRFLESQEWISFMVTDEKTYFDFTLPATIFFVLGTYLPYNRNNINIFIEQGMAKIQDNTAKIEKVGILLIILGVISTALKSLVNIGGINFILLLFSFFKFIGLFYLIACKSRYQKIGIFVIMVPFILTTFVSSVFINLVIWTFFLGSYLILNKRYSMTFKIVGVAGLIFLGTIIQVTKHQYRKIVWENKGKIENTRLETFGKLVADQVNSIDQSTFILNFSVLTQRLNQGFILSYILENIPNQRPFVNGQYFYRELLGIALPRFVYPDKPVVGDRKKFEYFAGWRLSNKTMMNVGIMGDGYGNFGPLGGIAFCFSFGLFVSLFYKRMILWSINRPTLLLWIPLIFFYVMRAGNEFYIIANWMVKVGILVLLYFLIFERRKLYSKKKLTSSNHS